MVQAVAYHADNQVFYLYHIPVLFPCPRDQEVQVQPLENKNNINRTAERVINTLSIYMIKLSTKEQFFNPELCC